MDYVHEATMWNLDRGDDYFSYDSELEDVVRSLSFLQKKLADRDEWYSDEEEAFLKEKIGHLWSIRTAIVKKFDKEVDFFKQK